MKASLTASAWAIVEYFSYPVLVFVTTPLFLHLLGAQRYGYWMMLNTIAGLGGFLATGTGTATVQHVAAARGRNDAAAIERTVRGALALALAGGGFAGLVAAAGFFGAHEFAASRMGNPAELGPLVLGAALLVAIEQVDAVFASTLRGVEQFGLAARVEVAAKIAQILAALATVLATTSLPALYATLVATALARAAAKGWVVRGRLVRTLRPSADELAGLVRDARWGWVQGLGGVLFGVADRLLIGSLLGSTRLAWYSIAAQLPQQIHAVCSAGFSVILPRVGRASQGAEAATALRRLAFGAAAVNVAVATLLALPLALWGRSILTLWLGEDIAAACADILPILTAAYWVLAINVAPHYLLLGLGRMRYVALSNLAAGVVLLLVLVVLLPHLGLAGAGAARIAYGTVLFVNVVPLVLLLRKKRT